MMFWGNHMGTGGWNLLLGVLLWIVFVAVGIWLLARLFPAVGGSRRSSGRNERNQAGAPHADSAMQILQRRYARGELTKEEYETIRHDLVSS